MGNLRHATDPERRAILIDITGPAAHYDLLKAMDPDWDLPEGERIEALPAPKVGGRAVSLDEQIIVEITPEGRKARRFQGREAASWRFIPPRITPPFLRP